MPEPSQDIHPLRALAGTRGGLLIVALAAVLALAVSTALLRGRGSGTTAEGGCRIELRVARDGGGTEWLRLTPEGNDPSTVNLGAGLTLYEVRIKGCGGSSPGTAH